MYLHSFYLQLYITHAFSQPLWTCVYTSYNPIPSQENDSVNYLQQFKTELKLTQWYVRNGRVDFGRFQVGRKWGGRSVDKNGAQIVEQLLGTILGWL